MPQARSAGSSSNKSTPAKSTAAKSTAAKSTAAKSTAAKGAAAKPAAKSTAAKPAAAKSSAAKSTAAKSTASKTASKTTASRAGAAKGAAASKPASASKASSAPGAKPRVTIHVHTEGTQVEAIAERVRKLNEKIIEVGRDAGENTLANYEKALKAIANGVAKGPAKDELEWIQQLAASQAKFVRDITESWAKSARERLK